MAAARGKPVAARMPSKELEPRGSRLAPRLLTYVLHTCGPRVGTDAHGVQGIQAAVGARVHTVEHCSWVDARGSWGCYDAATVQRMAASSTIVCPTIGRGWARLPGLQEAMAPALQAMHGAGVRLAASTDAGAIPSLPHHLLCDALPILQRCAGMCAAALRLEPRVAEQRGAGSAPHASGPRVGTGPRPTCCAPPPPSRRRRAPSSTSPAPCARA